MRTLPGTDQAALLAHLASVVGDDAAVEAVVTLPAVEWPADAEIVGLMREALRVADPEGTAGADDDHAGDRCEGPRRARHPVLRLRSATARCRRCRSSPCSTATTSGFRSARWPSASRSWPRWWRATPPDPEAPRTRTSRALGYTRGARSPDTGTLMTRHPRIDRHRQPTARPIAFVFPGQGSQYVGMGAELIEHSPAAAAAYARADDALGIPLSRMILEGPAEELDQTVNAQPAILATSVAFLRRDARGGPPGRHRDRAARPGRPLGRAVRGRRRGRCDRLRRRAASRSRARPDHAGARASRAAWAPSSGSRDEQVDDIVDAAREHGEISVANAERPGPDRALRRRSRPRLRPRDEQDGRRPQGGAPDGERREPLPAHAPRARRVRPHPHPRPVPRSAGADARQRPRHR